MEKLWYIGILLVLVLSCTPIENELESSDPSQIVPSIQLKRIRNEYNQIEQSVEVQISDLNNNGIDLGEGKVFIDNQALERRSNGFTHPYYILDEGLPLLEPGTLHTISINLRDGNTYNCYVIIPNTSLNKLILPSFHNIKEELIVQWEGVDNTPKLLMLSNSDASETYFNQFQIPDVKLQSGKYILNPDQFPQPGLYQFELITYNFGTIDPVFGGGSIVAIWAVESYCNITE